MCVFLILQRFYRCYNVLVTLVTATDSVSSIPLRRGSVNKDFILLAFIKQVYSASITVEFCIILPPL